VPDAAPRQTIAGFVYMNELSHWDGAICRIVARSRVKILGQPTFRIELPNGERLDVPGMQLRPWYPVNGK